MLDLLIRNSAIVCIFMQCNFSSCIQRKYVFCRFGSVEIFVLCALINRSQWPQGLRRWSAAEFVRWDCGFKSRRGHECTSLFVCFQEEVSVSGWSLV